jgi:hypothetical protein
MKSIALFIGTAILWILGEMLVQLLLGFLGLGVRLAFRAATRPFRDRFGNLPWWTPIAASTVLGTALGAASLLAFPHLFAEREWMRWVNLVATPLAAGLLVSGAQSWNARRDLRGMRLTTLLSTVSFTLAIAITRMAWADTAAPSEGERILVVLATALAILVLVPLAWHAVVPNFWGASLGGAATLTIGIAIDFDLKGATTQMTIGAAGVVFAGCLVIAFVAGMPFRKDRRRAEEARSLAWTPRR